MRTWVEVVVLALVCGACGGDAQQPDAGSAFDAPIDADEGTGYRVLAELAGVRDPMPLVLHDEQTGTDQQLLITEDTGEVPARFPKRLPDGAEFSIAPGGAQLCSPAT